MKKYILLAIVALGVGGCAIEKEPAPEWGCWVFVTTSENPVLLLAKSGLSGPEALSIEKDFKATYGKNNVAWGYSFPLYKNPDGTYTQMIAPETPPDCYEVTMILEFTDTPSVKGLFSYGFRAVRVSGKTAICKWYDWAYAEEDADFLIPHRESSYNSYKWDGGGGRIISSSIKKLGPEVHNMLIEF